MEREDYPSDLTGAQRETNEKLLPPAKRRGRRREVSRRDVVDARLYANRTGCQWRAVPHDFPHWKTVYNLFWEWRNAGTTAPAVWATWNPTRDIIDVQTADFNADGLIDIAGRDADNGQWRVNLSTGTSFGPTEFWAAPVLSGARPRKKTR